jgi:hypothetical protein
MTTTANRASAILCHFLRNGKFDNPFLLPANVCPVVPLSFMKAGVDFEFVDIDETHAMSKELALEKIKSGKYSGLVFVHAYGRHFDNASFYKEIKERVPDTCIIDDCCLCAPDLSGALPANVNMSLFSTGYAKYVELSFGGYGVTELDGMSYACYDYSEEEETKQQIYIKECLREGKTYDLPADYPWLDGSQLQMTQEQYFDVIRNKIPVVRDQKERINKIYREELPQAILWGEDYENWRFMISVDNRDKVLEAIFENDLFAGTNFPSVSWMFKQQHSKRAELEANHILNLFNDHRVNEDFAHKICKVINSTI